MRIVGPNFSVRLSVQNDVVVSADRPISYMRGWTRARLLALAARWGWKVELNDAEQAQVTAQKQRAELPERS